MTDERRGEHDPERDAQQHPSASDDTREDPQGSYPFFTPRDDRDADDRGADDRTGTDRADDRGADAPWGVPAGSVAYAEPETRVAPPRRRRRALVPGLAALLAAALVGGGAGYVAGHANDGSDTASSANTAAVSSLTAATAVPASNSTEVQTQVESVAQQVTPTVVQITEQNGQSGGTGSGAIISSDGLILTNNHVVSGAADGGTLAVTFSDGTSTSATIVGRDAVTDLAVIRAKTTRTLPVITLGDSSTIRVGQQVIAFGSPLGLSGTVTTGIISALNRPVTTAAETDGTDQSQSQTQTAATPNSINALQTDAAINPGNSGGPLVDLQGRLIGLNSAIASLSSSTSSSSQSGSIGLGFSIPVNQLKPIVAQLEKGEKATHAKLGVNVRTSTAANGLSDGAIIEVDPGSSAASGGLKTGDRVVKIDSFPVPDQETLVAAVRSASRPGDKVSVTFVRSGKTLSAEVVLGSD